VPAAATTVSVGSTVQFTYVPQSVPPVGSILPPTFGSANALPTSAWEYWMKPDRHTGEFFSPEIANYSSTSFRRIGHSFVALLVAALGGAFVRWRYEENSRKRQAPEVAAQNNDQDIKLPRRL
jgi:hypothetical protein